MNKEKENPKNWIIGDTFSLEIKNQENYAFNGRHLIFIKINDSPFGKGSIPIFRVKITPNKSLPETNEELEELEYIQTGMTLWEDRLRPLGGPDIEEAQIKERSKVEFYPDEFGYLSEYQITLNLSSKKKVPKDFNYLGNFKISKPNNEYIPFDVLNIPIIYLPILEDRLISSYKRYNKKDSVIYNMEYAQEQRKHADYLNKLSSEGFKLIEKEEKGINDMFINAREIKNNEINFIGIDGYIKIKYLKFEENNDTKKVEFLNKITIDKTFMDMTIVKEEGEIVLSVKDLIKLKIIIEKSLKKNWKEYKYVLDTTLKLNFQLLSNAVLSVHGEYAGLYGFLHNESGTPFNLSMSIHEAKNTLREIQNYIDSRS